MPAAEKLLQDLEHVLKTREAQLGRRRRLTIAAADAVDFSSNDFLSLSLSDELRKSYEHEFHALSHLPLGSGGSRLLDGNSTYMEQVERSIAAFHGAKTGLLFNSGFDANSGFFSTVPQPGDAVVYDEYIHASVHEGMRLSRARACVSFAHNSPEDLARQLTTLAQNNPGIANGRANVFVAVETIYSMDGDLAPLREILAAMRRALPHGNAHLIVDEAHSTGVYGSCGRGVVCELGLENEVFARLHTFGKALASSGAILLCAPALRDFLINYCRSLIYTTAMGLPTLAMVKSAYSFLQSGRSIEAQNNLWKLIHHFQSQLLDLNADLTTKHSHRSDARSLLRITTTPPQSPIFALETSHPRSLASYCQTRGFVVRPIMPPTVPKGGERVRVCLHAGNTVAEIDRFVAAVREWVEGMAEGMTMGASEGTSAGSAVVRGEDTREGQGVLVATAKL